MGLVVEALMPLGDYLREHRLVTGYGFERTGDGIVCRLQGCRFANLAHQLHEDGVACAHCPVFQLMQEALQTRNTYPLLRDHKVFVEDGVTCVFHLDFLVPESEWEEEPLKEREPGNGL
jgi:hypothetical protein